MKKIFCLMLVLLTQSLWADQKNGTTIVEGKEVNVGNKKVIYTYKQYEKFDFDDLNIEGDTGSPSDLSISPIHEKKFTNSLPYRKSFAPEIKKGIERVR